MQNMDHFVSASDPSQVLRRSQAAQTTWVTSKLKIGKISAASKVLQIFQESRTISVYNCELISGILGICRHTLMQQVTQGKLTCIRLAKNPGYFRPNDLDTFVKNHNMGYNPTTILKVQLLQ